MRYTFPLLMTVLALAFAGAAAFMANLPAREWTQYMMAACFWFVSCGAIALAAEAFADLTFGKKRW